MERKKYQLTNSHSDHKTFWKGKCLWNGIVQWGNGIFYHSLVQVKSQIMEQALRLFSLLPLSHKINNFYHLSMVFTAKEEKMTAIERSKARERVRKNLFSVTLKAKMQTRLKKFLLCVQVIREIKGPLSTNIWGSISPTFYEQLFRS